MSDRIKGAYALPAFLVIETFSSEQLNELDNGEYTLTTNARPDLFRDAAATPSQEGDVLSIQPDGNPQTRAAGSTGAYERCVKVSAGLVYRPKGVEGRAYLVPCSFDAPNKS